MKTQLILERFANGQLLERREQRCRSFVKQLWELLYVSCAQIGYATPRSGVVDVSGQLRDIDQVGAAETFTWNKQSRGTLALVAPHGKSSVFVPDGAYRYHTNNPGYDSSYQTSNFVSGENLGIVVGADATAVSPADFALKRKITHGTRNAVSPAALFQSATSGDNASGNVYDLSWAGLEFTVVRGFRLSSVKLLLFRTGLPGTLTLCLAGVYPAPNRSWLCPEASPIATATTDGNSLPTAAPYEWREFVFASPVDLLPGTIYALYLKGTQSSSNKANLRYNSAATDQARACYVYTSDGGANWFLLSNSPVMHELRGTALDELEYSGCEIRNLTIANPNASFTISRDFSNNSGVAQVIRECGLYAAGTRCPFSASSGQYINSAVYSFCIARDVLTPALTLNPGEVLRITYIPQIVV